MRREKRFKKMNTDLDTAKVLINIFGNNVLDDLNLQIKINGGDNENVDKD